MRIALLVFVIVATAAYSCGKSLDEPWEPPPADTVIEPGKREMPRATTALGAVVDLSIGVYRFVLSDQQGDICAFTPSCSHYAQQAIASRGPFPGLIMAVDRLERCNWSAWSYAPRYYRVLFDDEKMKLEDPVDDGASRGREQK